MIDVTTGLMAGVLALALVVRILKRVPNWIASMLATMSAICSLPYVFSTLDPSFLWIGSMWFIFAGISIIVSIVYCENVSISGCIFGLGLGCVAFTLNAYLCTSAPQLLEMFQIGETGAEIVLLNTLSVLLLASPWLALPAFPSGFFGIAQLCLATSAVAILGVSSLKEYRCISDYEVVCISRHPDPLVSPEIVFILFILACFVLSILRRSWPHRKVCS